MMMNPKLLKTVLSCFLIFVSAATLMAQEIEKAININNFNGIIVSSGIDLYLTQNGSEKVVLKGSKDLMEKVKVSKTSDGALKFEIENGSSWGNWSFGKNNNIKAYISFKTLNSLIASGGSDIYGKNQFKMNSLLIRTSGGSDVKLDLAVADLKVASSGGSDIYLKGSASSFTIQASGGSDVKAFGLIAGELVAKMSGGSDGEFNAEKSITVAASGASGVSYKGAAIKKSINTSGASDVTKVN
nr:DUF2807 domain-containing protein [Pseudopedobacter sp.]